MKKKIVVVGFGWASVGFLKRIDTDLYDVEVVSMNKSFLYTPLLAQNIKANRNLLLDISDINPRILLREKEVENVAFDENKVVLKDGSFLTYDYLILAHGSSVNTFNIPGILENCCFLKANEDANNIRSLLEALPNHSKIAVIGCGLTGSEVVGTLLDYHKFEIYAIDAVPRPLMMFDSTLSDFTQKLWRGLGVNVLMEHTVSKIANKTIYFNKPTNTTLDFDLAIWCGGIKMSPLTYIIMKHCNETYGTSNSRGINVNECLKMNNTKNVWALGDCANTQNPPTAQVAYQQGTYLVKHFNSGFQYKEAFKFQNKGQIGYVGNGNSVFQNRYFKQR